MNFLLPKQRWPRLVFSHLGLLRLGVVCLFLASASQGLAQADTESRLIIGMSAQSFPDVSEADIEVTIKLIAEEFAKTSGFAARVKAYTDEDQMRLDFEQGTINFVVSSSLILATQYDNNLFTDGFRFLRETDFPDQILIVGQAKLDTAEFRGKRVVLAKHDPVSELFMDYFALKNFKQSYKSSFKVLPQVDKVNQLLLKVFFDEADITAVYQNFYQTAIEMNPQLASKLKILAHVDNVPAAGNFFRKGVSVEFQEKVIKHALTLTDNPRGAQLLEMFRSNRIIRSNPEGDLMSVKQLLKERQAMLNGR